MDIGLVQNLGFGFGQGSITDLKLCALCEAADQAFLFSLKEFQVNPHACQSVGTTKHESKALLKKTEC